MTNGLLRQIAAGGHIHGGNMNTTIPKKSICLAGGTIYVIENAVSPAAKETGYEKLKRMVLNAPEFNEKSPKSNNL